MLKQSSLDLINKDFKLISISATDTVLHTLNVITQHNISGAPVLKDGKIEGCIDAVDILAFATLKFSLDGPDTSVKNTLAFAQHPINDVLVQSHSTWKVLPSSSTIHDVVEQLSQQDSHRVGLLDEEGRCVGLVSQLGLVKYLFRNKEHFPEKFQTPIPVVLKGKESRKLHTSLATDFVMESFQKMRQEHIGGLPIVDEKGVLMGMISATDIKRAKTTDLSELRDDLFSQIRNFVDVKSDAKFFQQELPKFDPIFVTEADTLESVVENIVKNSIHRVYVVDTDKRPINVVSLQDIISQFK